MEPVPAMIVVPDGEGAAIPGPDDESKDEVADGNVPEDSEASLEVPC